MPIVDIKGVGKAQFPDGMSADNIRTFLRNKYAQQRSDGKSDTLSPVDNVAAPYEPTLTERMGQGIASGLTNTGLVSDNYGAQRIGKNIASIGEFLPGVGDAAAGDEFGKAVAQGDKFGIAMAGLGVVPVAGDLAKKVMKAKFPDVKFDEIKTLPYKEKAKLASKWKTGQPIKLNYARNTVSSKNYPAGMDFGQKIEPAGRYMNVDFDDKGFNKSIPDWEFGEIEFENPIVLEHKSTNSTGWKKDLSEMFGGSTGKRLTNKLKKAGHDGIITKDADGFNETISIK